MGFRKRNIPHAWSYEDTHKLIVNSKLPVGTKARLPGTLTHMFPKRSSSSIRGKMYLIMSGSVDAEINYRVEFADAFKELGVGVDIKMEGYYACPNLNDIFGKPKL